MILVDLPPGISLQKQKIEAFKSDSDRGPFLYFVSGIRGTDVEGTYILRRLIDWLNTHENPIDIPIVIIPVLNIDGHSSSMETNANGVRLLEDFPENTKGWRNPFSKLLPQWLSSNQQKPTETESRFLVSLMKSFPPKALVHITTGDPMVAHCGPNLQIGSLIAKKNSYDLRKLENCNQFESLFSAYLQSRFKCTYIRFQVPKIHPELSLAQVWEHNSGCLKHLFESEMIGSQFGVS